MNRRLSMVAVLSLAVVSLTVGPRLAEGGGSRTARSPRLRPAVGAHLFACGELQCDARETYCETINTDVPILPSTHACRPLPVACATSPAATATCQCFPKETRGDFCGVGVAGGRPAFYRTAFGGH